MSLWAVTIKLPKNPAHNPRNKIVEGCRTSPLCTDATGEHHTFVVNADGVPPIKEYFEAHEVHITRIELIKNTLELT